LFQSIDIAIKAKNKRLKVKRITIPNYKKIDQFVPFENPAAALVNETIEKKNGAYLTLRKCPSRMKCSVNLVL